MSSRHNSEQVVTDGYQVSTNTVDSAITDVQYIDILSYQVNITSGTANGTFTVMASNDYDPVKVTGTFIATATTAALTSGQFSGSVDSAFLNITDWTLPYKYVKLRYVNTSGEGYFDAFISAKGVK